MSETRKTARIAGAMPAGRRFPERRVCGATHGKRASKVTHDIP